MLTGKTFKTLASLSIVAALTAFCGSEVQAGWGSYGSNGSWGGSSGGSRGSMGSWGSGGGSFGSGGSWGSYGSHGSHGGPLRRLVSRIRSHHSHGSLGSRGYYSSGGSRGYGSWGSRGYASHGSGGYSSGGRYVHYSSGGSSGGSSGYYSSPVYLQQQPMLDVSPGPVGSDAAPQNQDQNAAGGGGSMASLQRDAVLNLRLPEEAVVFVNGKRTRTPGNFRSYVSKNLNPGKTYTYEVRIELDRDGELLTRTKVVEMSAGANKTLDIDFAQNAELITSLTLFVPEDAEVKLGGMQTSAKGNMRYFSTKTLTEGEAWKDYLVSVTVNRNGRKITRDEVITIEAGDSRDLRFDFDAENSIASR